MISFIFTTIFRCLFSDILSNFNFNSDFDFGFGFDSDFGFDIHFVCGKFNI